MKHGLWNHPSYKSWWHMMDRCYNEKNHAYDRYGGAGIIVCDRWHNVTNFVEDMGEKLQGKSIDRINGANIYSKETCRWADDTQQNRNRAFCKLTLDKARQIRSEPFKGGNGRGPGVTRQQVAEKYGVSIATIKKVISGSHWAE